MQGPSSAEVWVRLIGILVMLAGVWGGASPTRAQPIEVDEADFVLGTAGFVLAVEDFEGFPFGSQGLAPLEIANGTYEGVEPFVVSGPVGSALMDQGLLEPRTFLGFDPPTAWWSARFLVDPSAEFDIVVEGRSGSLELFAVRGNQFDGFIGFHDPEGLVSVQITTVDFSNSGGSGQGIGNYGFDDVTTAVPEPGPAIVLPLAALAGAWITSRRRSRPSIARGRAARG
ncbi:MAG TPA: MYXO-CTERM sorting domain-containing protein [Myxococcota bacterium]|nr:MYXO-CTERM sorting domain-containing protein [Myxococcota bacterium]